MNGRRAADAGEVNTHRRFFVLAVSAEDFWFFAKIKAMV
jgi:hypothetical protein